VIKLKMQAPYFKWMSLEDRSEDLVKTTSELLMRLRNRRPLIHHITNMVVMNDTANVTLHIGGQPVMSHAKEEVAEMVSAAGALVLNIGTLTPELVESMLSAGRRANELGIPIILDPVGAGATKLRTESSLRLLRELHISIVRGNSGEIGALTGLGGVVKGVDSVKEVGDPAIATKTLANRYGLTAVITGARDFISDGKRVTAVDNKHLMLKTLTGTGCMSTTVIAAFAAVESDYVLAATAGLTCFGLAAELAAPKAVGPGSFKVSLFDSLYNLTPEQIHKGAKVRYLERP
jgi:hydroxyethylthiazole kinase